MPSSKFGKRDRSATTTDARLVGQRNCMLREVMFTLSLMRLLYAALTLILIAAFPVAARDAASGVKTEPADVCIILLHGLWRSSQSMKPLERALEEAGYGVVNQSYPSRTHRVEELSVLAVEEGLAQCRALGTGQVGFVTHSLGGILVRDYLSRHEITGLQRVVMLGPPNGGSQMAEYVLATEFLQPFLPPVIAQLGSSDNSVPRQLGRVNFALGVIAGTSNLKSFLPGAPDEPSDGTVAVAETVVPGMMDFIELPVGHTFMMWDDTVIEQTLFFLANGTFKRSSPPFATH